MDSLPWKENDLIWPGKVTERYSQTLAKWIKDQFACFWPRRGWMRAIHIELEAVLHEKAVRYSTIAKYLRSASFGERDAAQGNSDHALMRILLTRQFSKRWHSSHLPLSAKSLAWSCFRNRRYNGISPNPLEWYLNGDDEFLTDYRTSRNKQGLRNRKHICSYCYQWNINHESILWHSMKHGFIYVQIMRRSGWQLENRGPIESEWSSALQN
jgi:hypothetical protein